MSISPRVDKEIVLTQQLKALLTNAEVKVHQAMIDRLAKELKVTALECAGALSLLHQADFFDNKSKKTENVTSILAKQKWVRYRLDVGSKHEASLEIIKRVLVDVSGVDKMRIGSVDIRNFYTLVDLPDGMTADIFQLLSETEINRQRLNIKRVKYQRRVYRRGNKKS